MNKIWPSIPGNFCALEEAYSNLEQSKVVVIPVPYESTTTYKSGTREGPHAIISASRNLELYDEETHQEVYRQGIATLDEIEPIVSSPRDMVERVYTIAKTLLDTNKILVMLGGEHLLSLGMIQAFSEKFKALSVLQLDAHLDLRESYEGSPYSHACVMRQAMAYAPIVPVGIRAISREEAAFIRQRGLSVYYARDIMQNKDWISSLLEDLNKNIYLTIDLDFFDPSIVPSVGTPEPGGMGWYETLFMLREIARQRTIVGFDVVELCPQAGNIAPDFLAAKLVYKILNYIFEK